MLMTTINPRKHSQSIDDVILRHDATGLAAAILLFIYNNLSHPGRGDYSREALPPSFGMIDIWPHLKCHVPPLNMFYPSRMCFIRCHPPTSKNAAVYDHMLVLAQLQRQGLDSRS